MNANWKYDDDAPEIEDNDGYDNDGTHSDDWGDTERGDSDE